MHNLEQFKKDVMSAIVNSVFSEAEWVVCSAQHAALRNQDYQKSFDSGAADKKKWRSYFMLANVDYSGQKYSSYWRKKYAQQLNDAGLINIKPKRRPGEMTEYSYSPELFQTVFDRCVAYMKDHDYMAGVKKGDGFFTSHQLFKTEAAKCFMDQLASEIPL